MPKVVIDGNTFCYHAFGRLYLRRAVLRILLRANGPLGIAEIVRRLGEEGWDDFDFLGAPNKIVSDLLRHQVSKGAVSRVSRGVYRLRPDRISRSTLWRIAHWDR